MTTTVTIGGNTYEVDDNGACYVIKSRPARYGYSGTYRSRITSPRKIVQLQKMAVHEQHRRGLATADEPLAQN